MKRLASSLLILVIGFVNIAHAQYATTLLYIPINARSVGMGYGGGADNSVPTTIYFNPANVVGAPRAYISASNQSFNNDVFDDDVWARRADAGASWKAGVSSAWTLGANLTYAKMPGILFSEDGENLWAITIGAGYGANARSQLRFGGTIKRLSAEIPNGFDSNFNPTTEHIDGFAFDFGAAMVFKSGSDDAWNLISQFGMAATDQGSDPKTLSGYSDKLPSRVGLGASFLVASALDDIAGARVPVFSGILNLDAHLPNDGDAVYSIGMEAALVQILFMRTGVEFLSGRRFGDDSITSWGVGLGLPVQSFRFRLDYGKQEEEFIDGGVVSLLVLKEL